MTVSEGSAALSRARWTLRVAGIAALVGVVAVLYVVFAAMSKGATTGGVASFANGSMEKLRTLSEPRAQSSRPFKDANGATRTLADWRGKVTLVNFWATWCAPCVREMPTLAALDKTFEGKDFEVLAVSLDRQTDYDLAKEKLKTLSKGQLAFLIDTTMTIGPDSNVAGMPTTILYDRNGREIARLAGEADWSSPEAKRLIQAALDGNL